GDHVGRERERVPEHVAHEVRDAHPELLRAVAQLGLEAPGDARVDHAVLGLVVGWFGRRSLACHGVIHRVSHRDTSQGGIVRPMGMTTDLWLAALAIAMTWLMVFSASFWRAKAWSPKGMMLAFGNREDLPPPTGANGR